MTEPLPAPAWYPPWARTLSAQYYAEASAVFALHGNVYDVVPLGDAPAAGYGAVADLLAEQLFARWDLVLRYDLGRGLRAYAGRDAARLRTMTELLNRRLGDVSVLKGDPVASLAALDLLVREIVTADPARQLSLALIIEQASYLFPAAEPGRLGWQAAGMGVTVLNWATSPQVKRLNMAFVLVDEQRSALGERVVGNPHVSAIEIPLPDEAGRLAYLRYMLGDRDAKSIGDYDEAQLAALTAGMSLTDLAALLKPALEGTARLDAAVFRAQKKRLIERQCAGLLEFVESKWTLDTVVGHEAVKQRLRDDARLLSQGMLDSVPMGYLLCGPVGTGKSFLAQCAAGEMGMPSVVLKNFRSKYVGETEANLERVLNVLRAMGPVLVVVDEADAALGDRDSEGDSGTSSRVFAMIATQMGDTRYRGRIVWMLLTARPDLLPIDIKRQGRAEVHCPLFYPTDDGELKAMFSIMARKLGTSLAAEDVPDVPLRGQLSGADVEGIVGRAWRKSLLAGQQHVTREALADTIAGFLPSTQGLEKELQETAAILECTDAEFLPPHAAARLTGAGGRAALQERLTALKQLVEAL